MHKQHSAQGRSERCPRLSGERRGGEFSARIDSCLNGWEKGGRERTDMSVMYTLAFNPSHITRLYSYSVSSSNSVINHIDATPWKHRD